MPEPGPLTRPEPGVGSPDAGPLGPSSFAPPKAYALVDRRPEPAMRLRPGTRLGNYHVIAALGGEASGNKDIYLKAVGGQNPMNLTADSPAADVHLQ